MDKQQAESILNQLDESLATYVNSFKDEGLHEFGTRLKSLWFHFGNNGEAHTDANHRFIQRLIENEEYDPEGATKHCKFKVNTLLLEIEKELKKGDSYEVSKP